MTELERDTRDAYEGAATAWASGPEVVYGRLATVLLDHCPVGLDGALVLDVGAGTGVLGTDARQRGATCVDADVAVGMLTRVTHDGRQGVGADGRSLPFRDAAFDLVAGNCSLSHVVDPDRMLADAVRVTRAGGGVLFSSFPTATRSHDAWHVVETVLQAHGYRRPEWYRHLKEASEPQVGTPGALRDLARAAGVGAVDVVRVRVETGLDDPAALADWRLGMAQHAEFLTGLPVDRRAAVRASAIDRIGSDPAPLGVDMLILTGHA